MRFKIYTNFFARWRILHLYLYVIRSFYEGKTAQQLAHNAEDDDLSAYLESQEIHQENTNTY